MIKYTYEITKFNINPQTKTIISIEWWYVGTEKENSYKIFNVTQVTKTEKFVSLENVTEKLAISFIEKSLDKEYVKIMKKTIKEEIEKQKVPEIVSITPNWLQETTESPVSPIPEETIPEENAETLEPETSNTNIEITSDLEVSANAN